MQSGGGGGSGGSCEGVCEDDDEDAGGMGCDVTIPLLLLDDNDSNDMMAFCK